MVIQWCTEEELCDVRQDKASERRTKWSVWSEYRMMIIGGHHTPCPVLGILKASPGLPKFSHRSHGIDPGRRRRTGERTIETDVGLSCEIIVLSAVLFGLA